MSKFTYTLIALLLTVVLVSGFVMAVDAQNKTLIIGDILDGNNNGDGLGDATVSVTCNDIVVTDVSHGNGGSYTVLFNSEDCDIGDTVTITAEKDGYITSDDEAKVKVRNCESDNLTDVCSAYSATLGGDVVFNIAIKSLSLDEEPDEPAPTNNNGGGGGGSSGKKVVAKNNTVVTAPVVATADTADATSDGTEVGANGETIDETTQAAEDESNGAGITGGVIGAIGDYSFIIALFFIAGILIAYMYVRKRRSSFTRGFY